MTVTRPPTDVRACEACWVASVTAVRRTEAGRDLLCAECADRDRPRRVDLFPPYGIYGVTMRRIEQGRHGNGLQPTSLPRVLPG
ncbi:hypothetical protein [Streptomyces bacillaris]|uniref:hypothetical protein n=1 Tax=Streptomyces bacillaris TaxID=68179 RepID=UPI004064C870